MSDIGGTLYISVYIYINDIIVSSCIVSSCNLLHIPIAIIYVYGLFKAAYKGRLYCCYKKVSGDLLRVHE